MTSNVCQALNSGAYPFPAKFIAGDCFTADLTKVLPEKEHDGEVV
jgi:hypothetical protein